VEFCVELHWTDFAFLLAFILIGCAATFVIIRRSIRRSVSRAQAQIQTDLLALTSALQELEIRLAELRNVASASASEESDSEVPVQSSETQNAREPVDPHILAAITAAATTFLGRHVHILSLRSVPLQQSVSPWSQQGRVFVQASHNLRARR
jgi:hypothetical protein